MLARLRAVSDAVNQAVICACVGCVVVMLSISFVGFFYMVVTGDALSWTYSLARLFIPWLGLMSITVAFRSGDHVAMGMIVRQLPPLFATAIGYLNVALIALLGLLLIWYGWEFFLNSTQYYMVSDQFQVHHRWVAAAVPVTGVVMLIHVVNGLQLVESTHGYDEEISTLLEDSAK
jgi:TRAP-type C4-dicarboxylate transport system permease small subunit